MLQKNKLLIIFCLVAGYLALNLQAHAQSEKLDTVYQDAPYISQNDLNAVMKWIKSKETAVLLPYCYRKSTVRGAGIIRSICGLNLVKDGAFCYPKCQDGYSGTGVICAQNCPPGYRNDGLFCAKPSSYGRGAGYALWDEKKCNDEHSDVGCEKNGALWYPKCKTNFHSVGCCVCSPNCPSGFGEDIGVSCTKKTYTRGAGEVMQCPPGYLPDETGGPAGLCYVKCDSKSHGVGPVCWQNCPPGWTDCGAGCATTTMDCASKTIDQVLSPILLAASIATFGATGELKEGIETAKEVGETAAKGWEAIKGAMEKEKEAQENAGDVVVIKRTLDKSGEPTVQSIAVVNKDAYNAAQHAFETFGQQFATQTSPEINEEIDKHLDQGTSNYVKQYWGNIQFNEMAAAQGMKLAKDVLDKVSVAAEVDPTGIASGIVSTVNAFTHPICDDDIPFPDLSGR
jgi:hypothetical protein